MTKANRTSGVNQIAEGEHGADYQDASDLEMGLNSDTVDGKESPDNKVTTEQRLYSMEDLVEMKDGAGILDFRKNLTKLCRTE